MNKNLALQHDTAGKLNRIDLRVHEMREELKRIDPELLNRKLTNNKNLSVEFYLHDIQNMVTQLQNVLDNFYVNNKE